MGKGYGSTTIPVHAGIVYDLNMLYKKFRSTSSARLADFTACFREMGLNEVWRGRQSAAELIEFSEKLLQICSTYMSSYRQREASGAGELLAHTLDERMFGVYCSYAFYFLQPTDYVTCIRVTPEDLTDIVQLFQDVLVPNRHLDAACCLYKLMDAAAFRLVPFQTPFDPAFHRRYDVPDCEEIITEFADEPFQVTTDVLNDPLFKQLGLLQEKYDKFKLKHIPDAKVGKNLHNDFMEKLEYNKVSHLDMELRASSYIVEDLEAIQATIQRIEAGQDPMTGKSSKSILKQKAYKSNVKFSRVRRYANPDGTDVNDENSFKKKKQVRMAAVEEDDIISAGEEANYVEELEVEEVNSDAMSEISNPNRGRGNSRKCRGRPRKDRSISRENKKVTPPAKEENKAQKKVIQKAELMDIEYQEEVAADIQEPLKIVSGNPTIADITAPDEAAVETDPEILELIKICAAMKAEEKNVQDMGKLLGTPVSPAKKVIPKKRARRGSSAGGKSIAKNPPKKTKKSS